MKYKNHSLLRSAFLLLVSALLIGSVHNIKIQGNSSDPEQEQEVQDAIAAGSETQSLSQSEVSADEQMQNVGQQKAPEPKKTYAQVFSYARQRTPEQFYGQYKDKMKSIEKGKEKEAQFERMSQGKINLTQNDVRSAGYELTVHLIPQTRLRLGWKKLVDDYYSGTDNLQDFASVRLILDSIVSEMQKDHRRKFTFPDVKFLKMWYDRQNEAQKKKLKTLIQSGQLEVVNGGWGESDQATPNYEDLINNMMVGHQWMQKEFGIVPKVAWDMRTPGHSATSTRLFAQLGFHGQFFAQVDEDLKQNLLKEDKLGMNFIWQPSSANFGDKYQLFTSIVHGNGCQPGGQFFDINGQGVTGETNDPFVADKTLRDFNAQKRAISFVEMAIDLSEHFRENHIVIPWGCDYSWMNARSNYAETEALIDYVAKYMAGQNVKIVQSTPSDYLKAIQNDTFHIQANESYPVFHGDLIPFRETKGNVWTGYFSQSPQIKASVRTASAMMHTINKMFAMKVLQKNTTDAEVAAILDAKNRQLEALGQINSGENIAGQTILAVQIDNQQRVSSSLGNKVKSAFHQMLVEDVKQRTGLQFVAGSLVACKDGPSQGNDTVQSCPIFLDQNRLKKEFFVLAYNSQMTTRKNSFVEVKLPQKDYKAQKWSQEQGQFVNVESDIIEQNHFDYSTKKFVDYEMFIPTNFEANKAEVFKIIKISAEEIAQIEQQVDAKMKQKQLTQLAVNQTNQTNLEILGIGPNQDVLFKYTNPSQKLQQTFGVSLKYYKGFVQMDTKPTGKSSEEEAYINSDAEAIYTFKTQVNAQESLIYSDFDENNVIFQSGQFLDQYSILFEKLRKEKNEKEEQAVLTVRFSPIMFDDLLQFSVSINSIDVSDDTPKDITVNWKMYDGFDPKGEFYTDSNGLEMQKRVVDKRSFDVQIKNFSLESPVPRNYYPVASAISMRDQNGSNIQVTIMNDRTQGGTADVMSKATIELMQHRRGSKDDTRNNFDQSNNEVDLETMKGLRANAIYYMQIFDFQKGVSKQREQQIRTNQPIQYVYNFDQIISANMTTNDTKLALSELAEQSSSNINGNGGLPVASKNWLGQFEEMNALANKGNQDLKGIAMQIFPQGKQQVLIRLENLQDKFDAGSAETKYINMIEFSKDLWFSANPILLQSNATITAPEPVITETTLTGVELLDDAAVFKEQLTGKLTQVQKNHGSEDQNGMMGIALDPQYIRTFTVQF